MSELFCDVIRKIIKHNFQISRELKKVNIDTECKETKEGMSCKVYISGFLDDVEISEEHDLTVRLKRTVCEICSKKFGGYHEAIVQIRTEKRKLSKDKLDDIQLTVETLIEDLRAKGNRGLFITDIGEEHGGLDFFISEKGAGIIIAKKIQDQYGGEIKQSSKNIGMKDGRQLYRMTYLLRLPPYARGDFIKLDNSVFQISSIHGNKVKLIELKSWNETMMDFKTINKANILGGKELIKEMILVSQTKGETQLMDSKNYEIRIVKKPKSISYKTEKINVIKNENQIFILPKTKTDK
jgi:nonsense-mediated mRNA decay protein 3